MIITHYEFSIIFFSECTGSGNLSWSSSAEIFDEDQEWFTDVNETRTDDSLLVSLSPVSNIFTGLYTCHNDEAVASIYLFVNGEFVCESYSSFLK